MQIKHLTAKDEETLIAFLQPYVQTSMFMLGNIKKAGLDKKDHKFSAPYVGLFDDKNQLQGVMVHYINSAMNLMCQVPHHPEMIPDMLKHLLTLSKAPIKGIVGDGAQSKIIYNALNLSKNLFALDALEEAYILTTQNFPHTDLPEGFSVQHVLNMDKQSLLHWQVTYDAEALNCEITPKIEAENKEQIARFSEETERWVLYKNNTPVSYAGFNASYKKYKQIGPVYTPKEHRGQGYAGMLLAQMIQQAKQQQEIETIFLFTDNPHAMRTYEKLGFDKNGQFALFLLKEPFTPKIESTACAV